MRNLKFNLIFLILINLGVTITSGQETNSALTYMQDLSLIYDGLKNETWQYLKAVTKGKGARKVEKKRQELIKEVSIKKGEVRVKKAFTEDGAYKKAVLDYLEMTYTVLKEDFDKILDMEDIAEQSYDLMEAYILAKEKANDKLESAFDELKSAQEVFASNNNINLIEGEADRKSKKIEKAGDALEYYNDIYLIFFKSYKQDVYIIDAISRGDINALEQNINTMIAFNKEATQKLDELDAYNGDASLIAATKEVLSYFDIEAKEYYPSMVDFFVAKDNFEKLHKAIEATKKSKRTKEDIDKYNKAAEQYNKKISDYNKTNELANKGRTKSIEIWNKEVDKFFSNHAK